MIKMNRKIYVIFLILTSGLLAQDNILDLTMAKRAQSESNWDLNIILNSPQSLQPGISIEVPQQIRVIPLSIQVNQKNYWLQNSNQVPEIDSAATWQATNEGLLILFQENQVANGDILRIDCLVTLLTNQVSNEEIIQIKPVSGSAENYQVGDQIVASKNIPVTLTR